VDYRIDRYRGSRAAQRMIAAEVLGADINDVRPIVADTDQSAIPIDRWQPHCVATDGRYTTLLTTPCAQTQRTRRKPGKRTRGVRFANGLFSPAAGMASAMTLKQLAPRLGGTAAR